MSRLSWKYAFVTSVSGNGKALLITGCDTGFGHRLAKRLSRDGFLVFAGCLSSMSDGAKQLRASSNVEVLQLDVPKQEQVDDALHAVKKHLGARELWSVVANAGVLRSGLLEWLSMDTIVDVFDVNVFGVLRVAKTFLPLLKKSKGRVVTVASPLEG
ncbi:D-beta-hydroxybutyrate dehydrogenase, mitochondrial-like [Dermacentor variabilis]|uniref:D-beta-hydroxybutyrate dehydrogenase, mitochondrial-like n=1 Tax=Dermacentor variabilis TaxID=34621 RepID=UPI003F5C4BA0